MRVQPIEKSVWPTRIERNHTFMRWQQAAVFTRRTGVPHNVFLKQSDTAHGKFTEVGH